MPLRTLDQCKRLFGKRVILRVDFNIPMPKDGRIARNEDERIRATLPTIEHLATRGAKVVILSHFGRPKGWETKYSLFPIARHLSQLLGKPVRFVGEKISTGAAAKALATLSEGEIALLENVRFYPGEEKNDKAFGRKLAALGDLYINDAFAVSHREQASVVEVAKSLNSYAGFALQREVEQLTRLLKRPKKPYVVLMGGAKISTKLPTVKNFLKIADKVLLGGGLANAFFRAKGWSTGKSEIPAEEVRLAKALMKNKKIVLPVDVLVADRIDAHASVRVAAPHDIRSKDLVVDVGPATVRAFSAALKKAKTLVWNGPLGIFEVKKFSHGSVMLGRVIASRSSGSAFGAVGGGETVACLGLTGMSEYVDHVSTGGGAMLEFLSGKVLPGIKPLLKK